MLKSGIKVWVWLEGNQCSGNRRFSWGAALSPSSGIVHSLLSAGCRTSCSLFRKFSPSRTEDAPTQHDEIQPWEGCALPGVWAVERNTLLARVVHDCKFFHFQDLNLRFGKTLYHTVCIQKTPGVKPFNSSHRT